MKQLGLAFLLLSAAAFTLTAQDASFAGKWTIHSNIAGNEGSMECTFAVKESVLAGTCAANEGTQPVTGKVDGKNITWQRSLEYGGQSLTLVYTGKLESPEKIVGTVEVQGMGAGGDFTATAVK